MERLISFVGLFVMIFLAWLMSPHKKIINWRVIVGGLSLQFIFAALILKTQAGEDLFVHIDGLFMSLLSCVNAGSEFLFGENFREHFFAFSILPTIIFFSAFMSLLYYLRVMQVIVDVCARVMQKTLGTSGAETMSTAANIFVGQTEAPLVVRPYLSTMTLSELNAVMIGGFGTVAGGVLAIFVGIGISPKHLITASVIAAPATLLIAKVMLPETGQPKTMGRVKMEVPPAANALDAVASGTTDGMMLALNVAAMLITFLALIAMINGIVGWAGAQFGFVTLDGTPLWSLQAGLSYLFAPLAWIMGIESKDCLPAGELLGIKMVANEVVAYKSLSEWIKNPELGHQLSERTQIILTYALCGFANFSSIGIQIGGIGAMAPERKADLARLGLKAMLGGALVNFMTACVAGILL